MNLAITKSQPSLQRKILSLFAIVLIIVSSIVAVTTLRAAFNHSTAQLHEHFITAKQVFIYKLINDGNVLSGLLENAAKDFSTKSLIASGNEDPESLLSVIGNQQNRANADFSVVLDKQLRPLVSNISSMPVIDPTRFNRQQVTLLTIEQHLYLVKSVPVRFLEQQPTADAWIIMGIAVNKLVNDQVRQLTGLEVSVFDRDNLKASTKDMASENSVTELSRLKLDSTERITVEDVRYLAYRFHANEQQTDFSFVFTIKGEFAHLNFINLTGQLSLVLLLAITLAVTSSFYIARGITQPIRALAEAARRIQVGDYKSDIPDFDSSEVHDLSSAFVSMQQGINDREKHIERLAYREELTGLPNRVAFTNRVKEHIATAMQKECAVIVFNLDRFKDVNDTLGHIFGDKLLVNIGKRIETFQLKSAFYAHLGADEFAIFLSDLSEFNVNNLIEQVASFFDLPFEIDDVLLDVDASFGAAIYPKDTDDASSLIQKADIALHKCKESHKRYLFYDPSFDTHSVQRLSLMSELRYAIEQNQLKLFYQPKLCLQTDTIVSVECLVRWIHPEHGFIGPDDFIPLAEKSGAIRDLTHWAITTAVKQHAAWREQGIDLRTAVNISALDLVDLSLPAFVAAELGDHEVEASKVTLEVTESAVMAEPDQAIRALDMLQRMGIKLSIDDFGTGFSSMAQLKKMPVSELKIDKSFVLDLATNKDDEVIVKSTADLAHNLGLSVVAEGVEDANSLQKLKENKIEFAQGYFIAKPMAPDKFDEWIADNHYPCKRV